MGERVFGRPDDLEAYSRGMREAVADVRPALADYGDALRRYHAADNEVADFYHIDYQPRVEGLLAELDELDAVPERFAWALRQADAYGVDMPAPPGVVATGERELVAALMAARDGDQRALQSYWREQALAAAGIEGDEWQPGRGLDHNEAFVVSVYDFYGDAYAADDELQWAAMGRLAGAPVYAGLQDLRTIQASRGFPEQAPWLERKLLLMQRAIFYDLGWQHQAYLTGGIDALRTANRHGRLDSRTLQAWQDIASGQPDQVARGNRHLLRREQQDILQEHYDEWPEKAPTLSFMTSRTAASPVPEGTSLDEAVPASVEFTPWPQLSRAEIHDFDDRWDWVGGEDAMWGDYQDLLDQPHADEVITVDVADRADDYRQLGFVPWGQGDAEPGSG